MGKRTAFSGLSRFVLQAFTDESKPSSTVESAPATVINTPTQPTVDQDEIEHRPSKKRKSNKGAVISTSAPPASQWVQKYDATGLVEHYTDVSDVPEHLKKYFFQRTRFLSLYATPPGCLLDEEGWYSITPELVADQIAERCRCDTILDAFCGVGGNAIAFAKTCQRVIALDTSPVRLALARHNAQIYGVAHLIEFIQADYISFAESYLSHASSSSRKIDVVFLSPPWGGPSYLSGSITASAAPSPTKVVQTDSSEEPASTPHATYSLSLIQPIPGADLFHLSRRITPNIAYYLPRNTDLAEVGALLESPDTGGGGEVAAPEEVEVKEYVEVEEEWMGSKLKALTCYFGGLVEGQGELF